MNSSVNERLSETWPSVWKILKNGYIYEKLCYFNADHTDDSEHISNVFMTLPRGYNLLKSAIRWEHPTVGNISDKVEQKDSIRGIQWKLVMAHAGLETIIKILMNDKSPGLSQTTIETFIEKCHLPLYEKIESPSGRYQLDLWLNMPIIEGEPSPIINFLGLKKGDLTAIRSWIVDSQPVDSWDKAVKLSKALRNATAHGALSATKVWEWGLVDKIEILTENLGEIAIAGLNKLIE